MASLFTKYRERLKQQHGWEVELECPTCHATAVPKFNGWTPTYAVNFGNTPTVYANVNCPQCGASLKAAAGRKLVELFSDVPVPARNRQLLVGAILFAITILIAALSVVFGRAFVPALFTPALAAVIITVAFMRLYFVWYNWQITALRHECACGRPAYKFMGMLGRSYCYRCSSCSQQLRLRD